MLHRSLRLEPLLAAGLAISLAVALSLGACTSSHGADGASAAEPPAEASGVAADDEVVAQAELEAETEPEGDPEPAEPSREPFAYTVVSGDTLWGIANANACTVAELQAANGIDGERIFAGQTLIVPPCDGPARPEATAATAGDVYTIQPGDYLELIASNVGCTVGELQRANGLTSDVIYAGGTLTIPTCDGVPDAGDVPEAAPGSFYVVQSGDFLGAIAERTGCSVSELMASNTLPNANSIQAGERLRIPANCTGRPVRYTTVSFDVDHNTLESLMEARGFRPPRYFKALVVEVTFNDDRSRVVGERRFDWQRTSDDDDGWNPASSVKLFAGIAAAQYADELGFTEDVELVFHGQSGDRTRTLRQLLESALGPSDNIAYNELVQFVGYDRMNAEFLSGDNGIQRSALRRAYERTRWMEMGESASFAAAPAMTLREGSRERELPARIGTADVDCGNSACTTLLDLAEAMRRLMLQEQLPAGQHFDLARSHLLTIRRALRTERRRGEEVVDHLSESFGDGARFYHKAGFSQDWYSDVVYISDPTRDQAWIVALAGKPGRSCLNSAASIIGELIASGELGRQ